MNNKTKIRNKLKSIHNKSRKTTRGGIIEMYRNELKKIYPNCQHDGVSDDNYNGNCITYGEMEYNGIQKFATAIFQLCKSKCDKIFIDIGCGNGKFPLYMASYSKIKRSLGIELVKSRFETSQHLLETLSSNKKFKHITEKVEFYNDDMLNFNFQETIGNTPCFIWISNLCFSPEITRQLFDKLFIDLPEGSLIGCSKHPFTETDVRYKLLKTIPIPMSWKTDGSEVHFFEKI